MDRCLRVPFKLAAVAMVIALTVLAGACAPTDAVSLDQESKKFYPAPERGTVQVIFGVAAKVPHALPGDRVRFTRYNPNWRALNPGFDGIGEIIAEWPDPGSKAEARIVSVPSGYYVWHGPTLVEGSSKRGRQIRRADPKFFLARPGEVFYLGDFVLVEGPRIEHRLQPTRIAELAEELGLPSERIQAASFEETDGPVLGGMLYLLSAR